MKNTRRFIAAVTAAAMFSAIAPMTALVANADVPIQDDPGSGYLIGGGAEIFSEPTLKTDLTYTGEAQELINTCLPQKGTTTYYYVSDSAVTPQSPKDNNAGWSTDVPTGTAAGDYYVYWFVDGGSNSSDYGPALVGGDKVTISSAAVSEPSSDTIVIPDTNGDPAPSTATFTATLDAAAPYAPTYTVTIPAGVTLSETEAKTASITATDVDLADGKKIKVTLTGASNTESGTSFTAKNSTGTSSATYTITRNDNIVGLAASNNTLAEFTADGLQTLTFSKAEGATYAGEHNENLTFTIAVVDTD